MTSASRQAYGQIAALQGAQWQVKLLGGMSLRHGDRVLHRFPSRPIALLFARLALFPQRSHAREELAELLWPGAAPAIGRNRLRHALSTLRTLLENPGQPGDTLLSSDRISVRMNAGSFQCDALVFEAHARQGHLAPALDLYDGELLPGFYDEWVEVERRRLAAIHERLLSVSALSPPSASADSVPGHQAPLAAAPTVRCLPGYMTSFFGRAGEIAALNKLVSVRRLVTLSGPGGCGKTRLALESMKHLEGFDEVVFVGLADCHDSSQLADHVRAALGLREEAQASALEQVVGRGLGLRLLLLLDNFEQLVDSTSLGVVLTLLQRMPQLHLLLTSRRSLQRAEEYEFALAPLPPPATDAGMEETAQNESVALFIDRARAVRADFHLQAANCAALVELCRVLEGLPLALEIAASRTRGFAPAEMCAALTRSLSLLARTGPRAAREGRHASLQAAFEWSWRLLNDSQQDLLAQLTAFRGGWTSAAAEAVASRPGCLDLLESLVIDSLVRSEDDGHGGLRFGMLEIVRQFVSERMAPPRALQTRRRHRDYWTLQARAWAQARHLVPPAELPNCLAALRSALVDDEPATAITLALALQEHWLANGTSPQALSTLREIRRHAAPSISGHGAFLSMLARLLLQAGHAEEAGDCANAAMAHAGAHDAQRAEALFAHTNVQWVWRRDGASALAPAHDALQLARAHGSKALQARAAMLLAAITLWHLKMPARADALYQCAEQAWLELEDLRGVLQARPGRVACLQSQNLHQDAISLAVASLQEAQAQQQVEAQLLLLNRLSLSYRRVRQFDAELQACRLQTRLAAAHHMAYHQGLGLWNQCHPLARLHRPEEAGMLMAFSERFWTTRFGPIGAEDLRQVERVRRLVTLQIGVEGWRRARARGLVLGLREGLALACA